MNLGKLFIVTAASGAGKTSLVNALLKQDARLRLSVSHTTRKPRPGETHGVDYHFVDESTFLRMLAEMQFLENAEVHGARYGTAQAQVLETLSQGYDVILEIDWQGAAQVRRLFPQAIGIFILPPSMEALAERLNQRGQDSAETIAKRVLAAREEMRHVGEFDYVIINDDFTLALQELDSIVRAQRLVGADQLQRHAQLVQSLT